MCEGREDREARADGPERSSGQQRCTQADPPRSHARSTRTCDLCTAHVQPRPRAHARCTRVRGIRVTCTRICTSPRVWLIKRLSGTVRVDSKHRSRIIPRISRAPKNHLFPSRSLLSFNSQASKGGRRCFKERFLPWKRARSEDQGRKAVRTFVVGIQARFATPDSATMQTCRGAQLIRELGGLTTNGGLAPIERYGRARTANEPPGTLKRRDAFERYRAEYEIFSRRRHLLHRSRVFPGPAWSLGKFFAFRAYSGAKARLSRRQENPNEPARASVPLLI